MRAPRLPALKPTPLLLRFSRSPRPKFLLLRKPQPISHTRAVAATVEAPGGLDIPGCSRGSARHVVACTGVRASVDQRPAAVLELRRVSVVVPDVPTAAPIPV